NIEVEEYVVAKWKIEADPARRRRHDRPEVRRIAPDRGPLGVIDIREASHAHLAIAKGLFGNPLDNVVAVARMRKEWREFAVRMATRTDVDHQIRIAMLGQINALGMIAIADIRGQRKDRRPRRLQFALQVESGAQMDPVTHRYPDPEVD